MIRDFILAFKVQSFISDKEFHWVYENTGDSFEFKFGCCHRGECQIVGVI